MTATTRKEPPVTREILEYLEAVYPDRAPDPDATDREIWMSVGAVRLVRKLRQIHEKGLTSITRGGV